MPETAAATPATREILVLLCSTLAGVGPDTGPGSHPGPRLVELFGGAQNIFKASLINWRLPALASSAQSLGTGRSMELAQDEMKCVAAAGDCVVCLEDFLYPAHLKQIYDPPLVPSTCAKRLSDRAAGDRDRGDAPSHALRIGNGCAPGL